MHNLLSNFLGSLKALQIWFHSAHVLSKGPAFAGDHVHIYGEIYEAAAKHYDLGVEKFIALTNQESFACPVSSTAAAIKLLETYPSPVDQSGLVIASTAYQIIKSFIISTEKLARDLEKEAFLTLGMSDYLSSLASEYENYFYFLQQRVKLEVGE